MEPTQRALQTVIEMIHQRGYNDVQIDDDKIYAIKQNGEHVYAYTTVIKKFNVAEIQSKIADMKESDVKHSIVLFEGTPTPMVKKVIIDAAATGNLIEIFNIDDLQYNITKHYLVPQHILVNKEEADRIKTEIGTNFQQIRTDDPVARFYNFRKGDVIKIVRRDGFVSFRIVK